MFFFGPELLLPCPQSRGFSGKKPSCHFTGYKRLRSGVNAQADLEEPGQGRSSEVQQWNAFPSEDIEGCKDLHSTAARGLLLYIGLNHRQPANQGSHSGHLKSAAFNSGNISE